MVHEVVLGEKELECVSCRECPSQNKFLSREGNSGSLLLLLLLQIPSVLASEPQRRWLLPSEITSVKPQWVRRVPSLPLTPRWGPILQECLQEATAIDNKQDHTTGGSRMLAVGIDLCFFCPVLSSRKSYTQLYRALRTPYAAGICVYNFKKNITFH